MNLDHCVARLKEGDSRYMKDIFKAYYSYVMSICMRYTKDHQEAEEVANDAFLKVYHNIDKYDLSRPFKTWISRITVNTCIDHLRKKKNSPHFKQWPLNLRCFATEIRNKICNMISIYG